LGPPSVPQLQEKAVQQQPDHFKETFPGRCIRKLRNHAFSIAFYIVICKNFSKIPNFSENA
jgi:hypothetical protein